MCMSVVASGAETEKSPSDTNTLEKVNQQIAELEAKLKAIEHIKAHADIVNVLEL